jgi:hypothetical protein
MNIVERDRWYYVVDCGKCQRTTVLADVSPSTENAQLTLENLSWQCRHCGKKQTTRPEEIQRCQGIYI